MTLKNKVAIITGASGVMQMPVWMRTTSKKNGINFVFVLPSVKHR